MREAASTPMDAVAADDDDTARSAWLARIANTAVDNSTLIEYADEGGNDARFLRCWRRQSCKSCLGISSCSWCPFSSVCVPNDHLVPALAPAFDGDLVCPYWAERWELRARPLGCQVSTITGLTALVAGSGTLAVAALCYAAVVGVRRARQWQLARPVPTASEQPDEHAPLLPG